MTEINKDMITALVDGEVSDIVLKQEILSKIDSDKAFGIEYKVQALIKNLVKEKVVFQKTPYEVRAKILKSIGSDAKVTSANNSFITNIFEKPSFSFATAFVVVLAVVLIILNGPGIVEKKDFASEQLGKDNMLVQARNNFDNILTGKLTPQFNSTDAVEIKKFFAGNGVQFSALVPTLADWNLSGAFVSDEHDEKLAHLVYTGKIGEFAYLFQVDESYLKNHEIIFLSNDLIKYLDEGNCYVSVSNGSVTLFTKMNNNIFAIVSNGNPKAIENVFCSLK